ncbi:MAG: hypothetical protein ACRC62_35010 [Microcoleus sp.]
MPAGPSPRAIYKLRSRFDRLCNLADQYRGESINFDWLQVSDAIAETLDHLESLGFDFDEAT